MDPNKKAKEEADRKAKEEAARKAKEEADRKATEEAAKLMDLASAQVSLALNPSYRALKVI